MSAPEEQSGSVATAPEPSEPASAIVVRGLTKRYGDLYAVQDLSLRVPKGSIYGLVGPNGAGKTTTFSVLATLLLPTAGTVEVAGFDPVQSPRDVRARMGFMPDILGVYDNLRVDEYLRFFASAHGIARRSIDPLIGDLLDLVDLSTKREAMVDSLSRGMKQRLSLARALVHDPEVLILDEPASGLDPRARVELRALLQELRSLGKTIVVSSHILSELEEICTEIAILEAGRLLVEGPPAEILRSLAGERTVAVHLMDGTVETYTVASEEEQVELLARLVAERRPILEFRSTGRSLEDVFMKVTKGIVQ